MPGRDLRKINDTLCFIDAVREKHEGKKKKRCQIPNLTIGFSVAAEYMMMIQKLQDCFQEQDLRSEMLKSRCSC